MITHLHLIRHGETNWNAEGRIQGQSDSRLNETGRSQARELREQLWLADFDGFYCSSSRRARETMEILLNDQTAAVRYMDALREISLGPWEKQTQTDVISQYPQAFEDFRKAPDRFCLPGAETFDDVRKRGVAAVRQIVSQHPGRSIMVVSHGAIIKTILCHYAHRPLRQLWDPPSLHNCAHSIVAVDGDGRGRVLRIAGEDRAWKMGHPKKEDLQSGDKLAEK
jgi:probable phosphoglycerate mutase